MLNVPWQGEQVSRNGEFLYGREKTSSSPCSKNHRNHIPEALGGISVFSTFFKLSHAFDG